MELKVEGNDPVRNPDETELRDALSDLDDEGQRFAILSVDEQTYIQTTGMPDSGYILEYRDGSPDEHFRTTREDLPMSRVEEVFLSYARGDEDWRTSLDWEKQEMQHGGCLSLFAGLVVLPLASLLSA